MLAFMSVTPNVTTVRHGFSAIPPPLSKQTQLRRFDFRRRKMLDGKMRTHLVEAELVAGRLEAPADHPGDRPSAGLPLAPFGIVILAAAHIAHQLEYVAVAIG